VKAGIVPAALISLLYALLIFLIAWRAHQRKETGRSIIANPYAYSLSIAVYCTSWTFYGSVGKAATTGIDFLMIYLGPSLTAFPGSSYCAASSGSARKTTSPPSPTSSACATVNPSGWAPW